VLRRLDPHGRGMDQHLNRPSGESVIHIPAKVVEPHVALRPHLAGQLAAEDPPEAGGLDGAATGVAQHHLGGRVGDPPLGIGA
jgi:hypothetical protein